MLIVTNILFDDISVVKLRRRFCRFCPECNAGPLPERSHFLDTYVALPPSPFGSYGMNVFHPIRTIVDRAGKTVDTVLRNDAKAAGNMRAY